MALDARLEALFQQSVRTVDGFLNSIVPGLEYPSLRLREGQFSVDDFLERYDSDLRRCSRAVRNFVLASLSCSKKDSDDAVAFVRSGVFDTVYYAPVLLDGHYEKDDGFEYVFCHEIIHARHVANYSLYENEDVDSLLLSYFDRDIDAAEKRSERDECLVDCTMAQWFESEDNCLTPIVKKHGLAYLWRMALNHKVWEKF